MPNSELVHPYKGLGPYTEKDQKYFFGREEDQETIGANLATTRLTILYGASGVGKTSTLLAGVVPFLRTLPNITVIIFKAWHDHTFLKSLKLEIVRAISERFEQSSLNADTPLDDLLLQAAEATNSTCTFIFDQFEDYFLYHPEAENSNFFEAEFARAVNRDDVDANFLISIRDDSISRLDRFQGRIPNLFGNYLRLEHLDLAAAERAIRRPLDRYKSLNTPPDGPIAIEDALVEAILKDEALRPGRLTFGQAEEGLPRLSEATGERERNRIETPFLQMVLTRLWNEERAEDSRILRLSTLERLEGAKQIVKRHLDDVMADLSDDEREISSHLFHYLVTPTGTKTPLTASDLVTYTKRPLEQVTSVLNTLDSARVLSPIAPPSNQPTMTRYQIFHDVLAPAILDWRRRYMEKQERDKARTKERARRLKFGIALLFVLLLIVAAIANFAVKQKKTAENKHQTEYEQIIDSISENIRADRATAEAILNIINHVAEGIQAEFTYLASSDDDLKIKQGRFKSIIERYFESEKSLIQVTDIKRKPIHDYEVGLYLYHLATLRSKYTKVELLFNPDYLGIGTFSKAEENSYEFSVSMWEIFRAWIGNELANSQAAKKRFRLKLEFLSNGKLQVQISDILIAETISYEKYKSRFLSD